MAFRLRPFFIALLIVLLPTTAYANAGTPLLWASILHLFLGNLLIGLIEGILLRFIFGFPVGRSIVLMIIANYLSAWVGWLFLLQYITTLPDLTINNILGWTVSFMAIAYILSVIIEWPLVHLAQVPASRTWRQSTLAAITVNGISYLLLIGWYWLASGVSLITQLHQVPINELQPEPGYALFFITTDGRQVLQENLDGSHRLTLGEAPPISSSARLHAEPRANGGSAIVTQGWGDDTTRDWSASISGFISAAWESPSLPPDQSWYPFCCPSFTPMSAWEIKTGWWAYDGIRGKHNKTNAIFRYRMETPFAAWRISNMTQIDDHHIVCQVGSDQICIIDPLDRRIALIDRGREPVVLRAKSAGQ